VKPLDLALRVRHQEQRQRGPKARQIFRYLEAVAQIFGLNIGRVNHARLALAQIDALALGQLDQAPIALVRSKLQINC
jgi:hypothetical protein